MSGQPQAGPILSQSLMDAQVGVLGSMLIDESCVGLVLSQISERDFVSAQYRMIFQAVKALFREGLPTTPIAVREKLGGEPGDKLSELLAGIMDVTATAANVDGYLQMLREKSLLLRLQSQGAALQNAGDLDAAFRALDRAMELRVGRPDLHALTFAQGYEQFFDRHGEETPVEHLDWAILQLNEVLKAELGNIVIIGAYPGDGKTALALQCAARFGKKHNVGYFSFESKASRLYDRHVAREALISSAAINANKLTEEDFKTIIALRDKLAGTRVTIIDAVGMTASDIAAYSQAKHFDVIFVDYIQQVEQPAGGPMKDFERVTCVSRELQKFAVRTDTAVISLSQLSRPDKVKIKYKGDDGEWHVRSITPPPTIGDLRSSGQIEQDADIILLMWREDYEIKDSPRIIQVAKNRNGEALDKVRCRFDGEHQTFSRIEPRPEPPARKPAEKSRQVSFWGDGRWFEEAPAPDNPFTQEAKP